jgi:methyltransferase (TIGR00027 family)
VALRRASHQLHDAKPLVLDDPLAVRILGSEYKPDLDRTPDGDKRPFSAGLRAFLVARSRLAEDALAAAYERVGARQYLLLGAGLDTFAYRNPHNALRVFEVDHPATQAWKQDLLERAAISVPESLTFVAVDFERERLRDRLLAAGFDESVPTMTAWLGVTPYLTPEAFAETLSVLAGFAPGSGVVFDYALPREALSPVEQLMLDSLSQRVALVGEPFQLFFTPELLRRQLAAAGLDVVEDLSSVQLNERYFSGRADGLRLRGKTGRVCCAVRQESRSV